jgi:hypothetical protein
VPVGSGVVGVNSTESFYVKEETNKKKICEQTIVTLEASSEGI